MVTFQSCQLQALFMGNVQWYLYRITGFAIGTFYLKHDFSIEVRKKILLDIIFKQICGVCPTAETFIIFLLNDNHTLCGKSPLCSLLETYSQLLTCVLETKKQGKCADLECSHNPSALLNPQRRAERPQV